MDENIVMLIREDIAAIKESLKSAHKRIDEIDALTSQIHKLASNTETLTAQVKTQNERMEKIVDTLELRMKDQGARIGALELKPAKKWDASVNQVLSIIIAAIMALLIAKFN